MELDTGIRILMALGFIISVIGMVALSLDYD